MSKQFLLKAKNESFLQSTVQNINTTSYTQSPNDSTQIPPLHTVKFDAQSFHNETNLSKSAREYLSERDEG